MSSDPVETRLARALEGAVPASWTKPALAAMRGLVTLRFVDEAGRPHVIEVRPNDGRDAMVRSPALALAHGPLAPGTPASAFDVYRRVMQRLVSDEPLFVELLAGNPVTARREATAAPGEKLVFLDEAHLPQGLDPSTTLAPGERFEAVRQFVTRGLEPGVALRLHLQFDDACAQACEFCEQPFLRRTPAPPDAAHRLALYARRRDLVSLGLFEPLCDVLSTLAPAPTLVIAGNDWARHPELDRLLERLEEEERFRVALDGPATALADPALAARVAALPTLDLVRLSLSSSDPEKHDAVVGAPGAGAAVQQAIALLAGKVEVQVNLVVTERTTETLAATIGWLNERHLPVNLLGFVATGALPDEQADRVVPRADLVRTALTLAGEAAERSVMLVSGLPSCALPEALRPVRARGWQAPTQDAGAFAKACEGCRLKADCLGPTASYRRRHGEAGLAPER